MLTLSTIFTDVKERISAIPLNEPVFIYIGVGTYAGLKNKDGILEPQNYHQYPPFLQDLKNKIVDLNLFIVLIDPMQEQPPYLIADKGFLLNNNNSAATTSAIAATTSAGVTDRIVIYSLLQSVYTDPYDCYGDSTNITEELRGLNKYVMAENITLLYHDFTGRRNNVLAEYFDDEIKTHLNHVIYGMSSRVDHGCYFDLSDASSFFPWGRCPPTPVGQTEGQTNQSISSRGQSEGQPEGQTNQSISSRGQTEGQTEGQTNQSISSRGQSERQTNQPISPTGVWGQRPLSLFNIYYYIVNDCMHGLAQDAQYYSSPVATDVNTMINTQIEQVISSVKSDLTNHMLSLLRIIFRLIVGDEQRSEIHIDYCFNFIAKPQRETFLNLYNDNNYIELYTNLIDYFSRDIDRVAKLKNHDLTGKEILQFITYGDKPYEWYANIKHHF